MSNNYVEFYLEAVEDREASIKAGRFIAKDKEYIKIMPPGGNLTVNKEVTQAIIDEYKPIYDAWKAGIEIPENGSALSSWPPITPAQLKNCKQAKVRTVEQLAGIDEKTLSMLGMGGRALKDKASAWLEAAESQGKVSEEITALKVKMDAILKDNAALKEDLALARAQLEAEEQPVKRTRKAKNVAA